MMSLGAWKGIVGQFFISASSSNNQICRWRETEEKKASARLHLPR